MSRELPRVMAVASLLAGRLIQRENTDFLGRMDEALARAQGICDEGDPCDDVDAARSYRDQMIDLASLALAQAAMAEAAIPEEIGEPAGSA